MDNQYEQMDGALPEMLLAFQDLARLSHHGVAAMTEDAPAVATALLKRLIVLCQASYGAIFLTPPPIDVESVVPTSAWNKEAFRLFALEGMKEEKARGLLMPFSSESFWTSSPSHNPSWLRWKLPLTLALEQGEKRTEQERLASPSSLCALLLFSWDGRDAAYRSTAMKNARVALSSLTDAVGAVVVRALSSEYMQALEARADRKALREMELLKAELLATVSHELRSPLASVKGYAATLLRHERRISREERHEFLLAIHEASDRLAAVIDSLLEMSELETATIAVEQTSVDITRLVREAVEVAEHKLESSGAAAAMTPAPPRHSSFVVRLEDRHGEPTQDELLIEADPVRLREVLDHLLHNAIIHASEGDVIDVTIRPILSSEDLKQFPLPSHEAVTNITGVQQRHQRVVVIGVHDNGTGIPSKHLARIFEPFYRIDTRLTRETSGMGLGLAICRRIIELHDGMLWAESEIGKGSTFYVCLPREGNIQNARQSSVGR